MDMTASDDALLSRPQAAIFLRERGFISITEAGLAQRAHTRSGPPMVRLGRRVFYKRSELAAWLESQLVQVA